MENYTCNISKGFDKAEFNKVIEALKPKQVIFTSDEKVYNELIKLPYMNEECLKLCDWVKGTYVVDMEKMRKATLKPFPFMRGII